MLQPVASSEPVTSPPICAAVMLMLSRKKPVGVQPAAAAGATAPRPGTRSVATTADDESKPISLDISSPSSQLDGSNQPMAREHPSRLKDTLKTTSLDKATRASCGTNRYATRR